MVTPQVVDYIKNTLAQGYAEDKVRDALVKKGWSRADVDDAFRIAKGMPAMPRIETPIRQAPIQQPSQIPQVQQTARPPQLQTAGILTPQSSPIRQELPTQSAVPQMPVRQPSPVYPQTQMPQSGLAQNQGTAFPPSPLRQSSSEASRPTPPSLPQTPARPATGPAEMLPGAAAPIGMGSAAQAPYIGGVAGAGLQEPARGVLPPKPSPVSYQPAGNGAPQEERSSRKHLWIYAGIGILALLGTYGFVGVKYGIYAFGINLFPFENIIQKVGLASPTPALISAPSKTPALSQSPAPTKTPVPTPSKPQINGRAVSLFGVDSEAGTLAMLSYSPDRKKIAYSLLADGQNLWIMDLASGSRENILKSGQVNFPQGRTPVLAAWNPDGSRIAIVAKDASGIADLYLVNPVSRTTVQLTQSQTPDGSVASDPMLAPQWNKSGSALLVFMGKSLWKIPSDALQKARITPDLAIGSFDWSQNETYIAYTIKRQSEENVWVMDSDGRNFKQLTFGGANQIPHFTQDGSLIYYASYDAVAKRSVLWSIGRDGSSVKQLATTNGVIREFAVSPASEDQRIISVGRAENGKQSLWMLQNAGGALEEALSQGEFEPMGYAAWSPSGTGFYVAGLKHFLMMISLKTDELPRSSPSPTPSTVPGAS